MSTAGHETHDASPRVVAWFLAAFGATLILTLAAAVGLWFAFDHADPLRPPTPRTPPPAPRLEVVGGSDLAAVNRLGASRLEGWGWRDPAGSLAHVPIERAIQLQAQRGWADAEPAS